MVQSVPLSTNDQPTPLRRAGAEERRDEVRRAAAERMRERADKLQSRAEKLESGVLFDIPDDYQFFSQEFLNAPSIEAIASSLIGKWPEFDGLEDLQLRYLWKKKGGAKGGILTLGKCEKVSGLSHYFSEADFVIWIAADNCRELEITKEQMVAEVYHELKHIEIIEDEITQEITYAIRPHDVEMFFDEVNRYGLWREALNGAAETFAQLRLPVEER